MHRLRPTPASWCLRLPIRLALAPVTEVCRDHRRIGADLLGGVRRDQRAEVEDDHLVADPHHEVHVVLDDEDAMPQSSARRRTTRASSVLSVELRPATGSSSSSTLGCIATARAMASSRRLP